MNIVNHNDRFNDGPNAFAYRLAGYNRDVGYIQSMTRREHGVEVPRDLIAAYIAKHDEVKRKAERIVETRDQDPRRTEVEALDYDPRFLSFKRKQEAEARRRAFEKQMAEIAERPHTTKTYKRWQGGEVTIRVDEIRANTKVEKPKDPSASHLIHAVARAFYIAPQDLISDRRGMVLVAARAVIAKLLRERNPEVWSLPKIAKTIGRKDHSTVINLLDTWEQRCRQIPAMREVYLMMGGIDAG